MKPQKGPVGDKRDLLEFKPVVKWVWLRTRASKVVFEVVLDVKRTASP